MTSILTSWKPDWNTVQFSLEFLWRGHTPACGFLRELCTGLKMGKEFLLVLVPTALHHLCYGRHRQGCDGKPRVIRGSSQGDTPSGRESSNSSG